MLDTVPCATLINIGVNTDCDAVGAPLRIVAGSNPAWLTDFWLLGHLRVSNSYFSQFLLLFCEIKDQYYVCPTHTIRRGLGPKQSLPPTFNPSGKLRPLRLI